MSTNAANYYQNNPAAMKPVREAMPELLKGFGGLHHSAMKSDSLDTATKELIALSIGLAVRCENCIYAHIEAAGVAVMMGGGPAYTYLPRVIEALDELGK
jgi:AhpD family alkylhydroperoxidase